MIRFRATYTGAKGQPLVRKGDSDRHGGNCRVGKGRKGAPTAA